MKLWSLSDKGRESTIMLYNWVYCHCVFFVMFVAVDEMGYVYCVIQCVYFRDLGYFSCQGSGLDSLKF